MKKELFEMRVYAGELFEAKTKLSKKQFEDILKRNKAVLEDPVNEFYDGDFYEAEKANSEGYGYREKTVECEGYVTKHYVFSCGISEIYLTHKKANDGYAFK